MPCPADVVMYLASADWGAVEFPTHMVPGRVHLLVVSGTRRAIAIPIPTGTLSARMNESLTRMCSCRAGYFHFHPSLLYCIVLYCCLSDDDDEVSGLRNADCCSLS